MQGLLEGCWGGEPLGIFRGEMKPEGCQCCLFERNGHVSREYFKTCIRNGRSQDSVSLEVALVLGGSSAFPQPGLAGTQGHLLPFLREHAHAGMLCYL